MQIKRHYCELVNLAKELSIRGIEFMFELTCYSQDFIDAEAQSFVLYYI